VGAPIDKLADIESEKIILGSRIVLAAAGLFATYLDPSQPSQGLAGYVFLIAYVLYSLLLLLTFRQPLRHPWNIFAHAIEIAIVCAIIIYTEGPSSPFFIFFTFVLFIAALRWQGVGALVTGAVLSLVLMALTASAFVGNFEQADVDRPIIRNIYLIVASGLFAFLGDLLSRRNQQLERLRLGRELHDGILQTLAAAGLRLHKVAAQTAKPHRDDLLEVARALNDEQRQLRTFVEKSIGRDLSDTKKPSAFSASELKSFVDHLRRLWNCHIELKVDPADISIDPMLAGELKFLLAESVANAVMHGHAKAISIEIAQDTKTIALQIKDDGAGLPDSTGEQVYDNVQLASANVGPRSIRQRVLQVRGSLRLTSSSKGVALLIKIPTLAAYKGSMWQ
jgi:signal transduction histidine kinase